MMLSAFYRKDETGFTLVELLVVILIIGILAAIAIPMFLNQRKAAREATLKSDLKNVATQVEGTYSNGDKTGDGKADGYKEPILIAKDSSTVVDGSDTSLDPASNKFGPIAVSDGSGISFQDMGDTFCLIGTNTEIDNSWYFNSGTGGLSKDALSCSGGDSVSEDGDSTENPTASQCPPEVKGWIDTRAKMHEGYTVAYQQAAYDFLRSRVSYATWSSSPEYTNFQTNYGEPFSVYDNASWWWDEDPSSVALREAWYEAESRGAAAGVNQAADAALAEYNALTGWSAPVDASGRFTTDPAILEEKFNAMVAANAARPAAWCG